MYGIILKNKDHNYMHINYVNCGSTQFIRFKAITKSTCIFSFSYINKRIFYLHISLNCLNIISIIQQYTNSICFIEKCMFCKIDIIEIICVHSYVHLLCLQNTPQPIVDKTKHRSTAETHCLGNTCQKKMIFVAIIKY